MSVLLLVWLTALGLMAFAISWMLGLIVQRMITTRQAATRARQRKQVESALIGMMQGRTDVAMALAPYRRRARLMAETLLDFMSVVRGGDREVVVAALEAVGVPETLRGRLQRGSLAGRLAAIEALAAFPGPETERALREAAAGPPGSRLIALESLARAGGEVSVDELLTAAEAGALRPTGRYAEFLRDRIVEDPAAGLKALESGRLTPPQSALVLEALGASGDYTAIPAIEAAAASDHPGVRAAAVSALGRLQHPAAASTIASALTDVDSMVRTAAAEASGTMRLASLADALALRLGDETWSVRFAAAAALARLGPEGQGRLRAAADGDRPEAARTAALTMAERGLA